MSDDSGDRRPVILCCVDQSPLGHAVAYTAAGFALQLGARIVLLRSDVRAAGRDIDQMRAHGELEQLAEQAILNPSGHRVRTELMVTAEPPATAIERVAASVPPLMIVLGSHGRGRFQRTMLGSLALHLMRDTAHSIVVVPPDGPEIIALRPTGEAQCHVGRVLIPVDFGPGMPAQLRLGQQFLGLKDCQGVLLHIAHHAGDDHRLGELEEACAALRATGPVSTMVLHGSPKQVLRTLLDGREYGLVIMGRDRHHAGSLASDLLRDSNALIAVAG